MCEGTIKCFCKGLSLTYRTAILKVSIPASILWLRPWKSQYQSLYQDWNIESLDTSLNIKTVISKVSIPVSISRLKISESRFQSQYQDLNFKSLDFSLDIKTQLSKVSTLVLMSRLNSWISNLCPNLETGSKKQKIL